MFIFPCDTYRNTTLTQGFIDCVEYIENLYNLCTSYLCTSWNLVSALKDYTYVNHSLQHKSCIDHFIVT